MVSKALGFKILIFRQQSFRHGCFITRTFWHVHHWALKRLWQLDISTRERFAMGTFQHGKFSAQGIFTAVDISAQDILAPENLGTWIFWHLAKQYGRFGTDILAPVLLCRNVHVPKCPRAELFLCRTFLLPKIPRAKKSPCLNVTVLKRPSAGRSAAPNGARAEMFP